jgi:hypothetical protein
MFISRSKIDLLFKKRKKYFFFIQQQNQVAATLDRAKQVTVAELNSIIGVG